jgi:hypothetical protein
MAKVKQKNRFVRKILNKMYLKSLQHIMFALFSKKRIY